MEKIILIMIGIMLIVSPASAGVSLDKDTSLTEVMDAMGVEVKSISVGPIEKKEEEPNSIPVFAAIGRQFNLSDEDIKLAYAIQMACVATKTPNWMGGEPLQYLSFIAMLRYFYDKNIYYTDARKEVEEPEKISKMEFLDYIAHECKVLWANYVDKWLPVVEVFLEK